MSVNHSATLSGTDFFAEAWRCVILIGRRLQPAEAKVIRTGATLACATAQSYDAVMAAHEVSPLLAGNPPTGSSGASR